MVFVVPALNPPHPALATTLNATGVVALAFSPVSGLTVAHAAAAPVLPLAEVSTVKGEPPFAAVTAEATETACAGPGVYTLLANTHVIATDKGVGVNAEVVATTW